MPGALLSTTDVIDVKVIGNWCGEKAGVVMAIYRIKIIFLKCTRGYSIDTLHRGEEENQSHQLVICGVQNKGF